MSLQTAVLPTESSLPDTGLAVAGRAADMGIDREAILARYRQLRAISQLHATAALRHVSRDGFLHWAKRLGLAQSKHFVVDASSEGVLLLNLAVYAAPKGRTPAIERYRKANAFPAGSAEAAMLDAMCNSRFSLFVVRGPHRAAGLTLHDLARQREVWLMDEGLEASCGAGMALASRVHEIDGFCMTSGAVVPIGKVDLDPFIRLRSSLGANVRGDPDTRFVEMVYRVALATGLMNSICLA